MSVCERSSTGDSRVVCIGEALVQLSPPPGKRLRTSTTASIHVGGAELNVAVAMARLGFTVAFVSHVGADPFGERVLDTLQRSGVDHSGVLVEERRPTGVYFKDYDGERTRVYYYRRGSAIAGLTAETISRVVDGPVLAHVTGVLAALGPEAVPMLGRLFERVAVVGGTTSFDVNYRPALWSPDQAAGPLLALADRAAVVFVGLDEANLLWDVDDVATLRSLLPSPRVLVVKDGPRSATALSRSGQVSVPALGVRVTEPVGAGDAFAAGYLAALLRHRDERTALRWGHILAARALTSVADQVVPPQWDVLERVAEMADEEWADSRAARGACRLR